MVLCIVIFFLCFSAFFFFARASYEIISKYKEGGGRSGWYVCHFGGVFFRRACATGGKGKRWTALPFQLAAFADWLKPRNFRIHFPGQIAPHERTNVSKRPFGQKEEEERAAKVSSTRRDRSVL